MRNIFRWWWAVRYGVRNGWWYGWQRYRAVRKEQLRYALYPHIYKDPSE